MGSSAYALGSVASAAINATGYAHGGTVNGIVVRRSGITSATPIGVGWEVVIGVSFIVSKRYELMWDFDF